MTWCWTYKGPKGAARLGSAVVKTTMAMIWMEERISVRKDRSRFLLFGYSKERSAGKKKD
jgi:hypothetical protein